MSTQAPDLWRRSAVETADGCLYRYEAIYERGFEDTSDDARRGTGWHDAAKVYIRSLAKAQLTSDAELARLALRQGLLVSGTPARLWDEIEALWWPWVERFELDLEAYLLAEERQERAGFVWTPDLVYAQGDAIEMKDFKTHWAIWSESKARGELQARWYAWQAAQVWPGFARYRITFEFIRYGAAVTVEFSPAEIETVEAQVQETLARVERARATNTWPATPGAQCGYCRLECPTVDDALRAPVRVLDKLDAERIAGEALVLAQAHEARLNALKAWCTTDGAVAAGDMEYAYRASAVVRFPIGPVMQVLTAAGIVPAFKVSASALSSFLTTKKHAHVRQAIEALAQPTVRTTFSARQVGDVAEPQPGGEE